MKIKYDENNILNITSTVYQTKKGALILNWGTGYIILDERQADKIAYDIKGIDIDTYNDFYNTIKT